MNKAAEQIILCFIENNEILNRVKKTLQSSKFRLIFENQIDKLDDYKRDDLIRVILIEISIGQKAPRKFFELLKHFSLSNPQADVIFLVEPENIEFAMKAVKIGKFQYSKLPIRDEELRLLVQSAIEDNPASENVLLSSCSSTDRDRMGSLVGRSEKFQQVYNLIEKAGQSDVHILLLGETGTGKDLASKLIHQLGKRVDGPYLPINLGAIPSELVASELFGHEKGSFTGAASRRQGIFERGQNGTVFLDEIESINEKVQVSLLRLIEQKEFFRLGGKIPIKSNVRIIAASNQDLRQMVQEGQFRKDLYYRLNVFKIWMPNLRECLNDIPLLVQEFVKNFNRSFNKHIIKISPDFIKSLQNYDWPGNVRELKNVVQRAMLVCEGNQLLTKHLPMRFRHVSVERSKVTFTIGTPLKEVEKEMILQALEASNNNRTEAAKLLGISRRALYNKLDKHDIH